jgi:hypothetical protein
MQEQELWRVQIRNVDEEEFGEGTEARGCVEKREAKAKVARFVVRDFR